MEAARRLDEWRVLQRKIPSMDVVPFFLRASLGRTSHAVAAGDGRFVTQDRQARPRSRSWRQADWPAERSTLQGALRPRRLGLISMRPSVIWSCPGSRGRKNGTTSIEGILRCRTRHSSSRRAASIIRLVLDF